LAASNRNEADIKWREGYLSPEEFMKVLVASSKSRYSPWGHVKSFIQFVSYSYKLGRPGNSDTQPPPTSEREVQSNPIQTSKGYHKNHEKNGHESISQDRKEKENKVRAMLQAHNFTLMS
jgi:hypothetical protein